MFTRNILNFSPDLNSLRYRTYPPTSLEGSVYLFENISLEFGRFERTVVGIFTRGKARISRETANVRETRATGRGGGETH